MPPAPRSSDDPAASSGLRVLLGGALVVLLLALVGTCLGLFSFGQSVGVAPSTDEVTRTVRTQTRRILPTPLSAPTTEADVWCGALHLFFETAEGAPVDGLAMLDGLFHDGERAYIALDEEGGVTFEPVRCSPAYRLLLSRSGRQGTPYDVQTTPGVDTYTVVVRPLTDEEIRALRRRERLTETCPLRVTVTDVDGVPVSASVRMAHVGERDVWFELDEAGGVDFPEARCDERPRLLMQQEGGKRSRALSLSRVPDDSPELHVVMGQTARVRVVDPSGEPVVGLTRRGLRSSATVALLDSGDFLLTGYGEKAWVRLEGGESREEHWIPLDGGLHELEMVPDREVAVTLLCDQCTGTFHCGPHRCIGNQPDLTCMCPGENATLDMKTTDALWGASDIWDSLASIPDGVDAITVTVSGERGSVRFTVAETQSVRRTTFGLFRTREDGSMPPLPASFYSDPYREYGLERDGAERFAEELLPGAWTLGWMESTYTTDAGWVQAYASRDFVLSDGEELDLGVIGQ